MHYTLRIEHVTRRFPGVVALEDLTLEVAAGEVHAIVGENGAGKSTLINIISGVLQPDMGRLLLDGKLAGLTDPVTARNKGIVTVHQEAELFGTLSVAENMALGVGLPTSRWGRVRWGEIHRRAQQAVSPLSAEFDVRQSASRLSVAERHLTQVAAAVVEDARIVLLDEPTSVLTVGETNWLFDQIDKLRARGVGIIYISHRQEEIFRLADRISVLRDGRLVWHGAAGSIDSDGLLSQMVGRELEVATVSRTVCPRLPTPRLRVSGLTDTEGEFHDVTFELAGGEILGLYGLVGSGRSELAQGIFGLRRISSGQIEIDGKRVSISDPTVAVAAGIAYLPEDRLRQAVCRGLSILSNTVLASLKRWGCPPFVRRSSESGAAGRQTEKFRVRMRSLDDPIEQLSGGNQQKVILARWVLTEPKVLLLDEPTRGVDVAAKSEIHGIIRQLADQGCAVLMISSELPEILTYSDRIGVFREGRLSQIFPGGSANAVDVAAAAFPEGTSNEPGHVHTAPERERGLRIAWLANLGLVAAVILLAVALASTTEGRFTTSSNLDNLLNNLASRGILALAAGTVILAGGIDISIGSLLALSAAVGGIVMKAGGGGPAAIGLGVAAGAAVGAMGGGLNAAISIFGRVHPIVVTLGTMTIFRGMLTTITGGNVLAGLPASFGEIATAHWLGVRGSVWILIVIAASTYFWLSHMRWGRYVYAVGSSVTASRLVGISKSKVWLLAYSIAGLLVGFTGMLELAQNRSMQPTMGMGYELRAIAAAVIGGVAIQGGRGTVVGVLLGAILLTMIENGLVLWQVSGAKYDLVIGSLLLAAVVLDAGLRRVER